ncbi:MAG: ester cyclase [Hyphomicrobiaceae bacterium]
MSERERNKAVVRRIYARIWSAGELDLVDELFSPDLAFHDPASDRTVGLPDLKALVRAWRTGLPDLREEVLDLIGEDDRVACRFRLTGTQTGPFLGRPPSGRPINIVGVDLYRFQNGRIVDFTYLEDTLGLLSQLGVMTR